MLKKTIIATALISSAMVAGSAFATGLQTLVNKNNTSKYYLAIANSSGICSTVMGDKGIADPGSTITSSAAQIALICGGSASCKTNTFAFSTKPKQGLTCNEKDRILVATTTLSQSGTVTFNYLNSAFPTKFIGSTSGTATVGTEVSPDTNGRLEIDTAGN